jgi:hypothetical protein
LNTAEASNFEHLQNQYDSEHSKIVFQIEELKKTSKFEDEIRQEQEQRKREEEEKAQRRTAFKQRAALFQNDNVETNGST